MQVYQDNNLYFFKTLCGRVSKCIVPASVFFVFPSEKSLLNIFYKPKYKRWTFCNSSQTLGPTYNKMEKMPDTRSIQRVVSPELVLRVFVALAA